MKSGSDPKHCAYALFIGSIAGTHVTSYLGDGYDASSSSNFPVVINLYSGDPGLRLKSPAKIHGQSAPLSV